jgi:hypothetical protein
MAQRFEVTRAGLDDVARHLRATADEMDEVVTSLRAELAREWGCWGDDHWGKTFEAGWGPGAQHSVDSCAVKHRLVDSYARRLDVFGSAADNHDQA